MNEALNKKLYQLICSLELEEIVPIELHSARLGGELVKNEKTDFDIKLIFAEGDPVVKDNNLIFRPMYEMLFKQRDTGIYKHTSKFAIVFSIKDKSEYGSLWTDTELQELFKGQQINKLLWPLVRQHVIDGMTRLGLPPITLKWIV